MITVHHLENSRSQRILWLLEELGLPYEIRRYQRDMQTMLAPPELLKVHPLGKSPVITDGDVTVAESGAIVEYLVGEHGGGRLIPPAGTPERRRYTYWLHFAEGTAMPPLLMKLVFDKIASTPMPFFAKPIAKAISSKVLASFVMPNIQRQLDFMEAELGAQRVVCRPGVHRGGRADELSARSGRAARGSECQPPPPDGLPPAHPRPTGLPGARWTGVVRTALPIDFVRQRIAGEA